MHSSIDSYGVMGYPVSHSYSPEIHNLFALQTQQKIKYDRLQVSPNELESKISEFKSKGGKGLIIKQGGRREESNVLEIRQADGAEAVSYTHLTLPTMFEV